MFSRIQRFRMTKPSINIIQKRWIGGEIKEMNPIYYDNTFGNRPYHKNVIVRTGYSKKISENENNQNQEPENNNYEINKSVLRFKGEKLEINPHYNSIF